MKLWIRSDLHCSLDELAASFDNPPEHDVCILAGDLAGGLVRQISVIDEVTTKPVILVAGNHEFTSRAWPVERMAAVRAARESRFVRFLEADQSIVTVHGESVRFLGGTLWTDFALFGHDAREISMAIAEANNLDFKSIFADYSWTPGELRELWTPSHARRQHVLTLDHFETYLGQPFHGASVVVTHHAPTIKSILPQFKQDQLSPCFASRLDPFIERLRPDLWVHGHVHNSVDIRIGETNVVCNPKGFQDENPSYDPDLVIEV